MYFPLLRQSRLRSCGNRFTPSFHLDLITTRVGLGVICSSPIPKRAFVVEYAGELLLDKDAMTRPNRRYQVQMKAKAIWDDSTVFIDAAECENESRFINHSCRPNCALYERQRTNGSRLGVFAETDIPPLQELTFRYSEKILTLFTFQCGDKNCISNNQ
ncbi:hypothetical protein PHYSODRAFT_316506 [Phytophthora sojae]|uniref:SET domain-containing protein n=1 Tax=Phytophthora sojae (strain P6497) TaxID=1094619 RepID=G4ZT89_PHYSP|nr:hypothetical protein PHYSODRAFT_316506 [Phytophthora sojae]EGZ13121.1 hypothetical protein PHYSODRAFT_316506 [Phytophthora sojae]|eukprot:XP_009530550.1 hypothetical protein PHYSODRAFT_316506 [Phytophthora sojae]